MKRLLALFLAVSMFAMLMSGCDSGVDENNSDNTTESKSSIDSSVTGTWYGPENNPVLDIKDDGTGSVNIEETAYDAVFTAEDSKFTVNSSEYYLAGTYSVADDMMTVITNYEGTDYTIIFTREPVVIPKELVGTHVYMIGEEGYEIDVRETGGGTCGELPYPPSEVAKQVEVYFVRKYINPDPPTLEIYVLPEIYKHEEPTNNATAANEDDKDSDQDIDQDNDKDNDKDDNNNDDGGTMPDFVPETIYYEDGKIICGLPYGDEKIETIKGGGSLVGTWTSEIKDGTAYIFGTTSTLSGSIVYTFNADGTGTILALGIIPGTFTYTLTGNRLDITVSMLGDTESGTGYVTIIGDVCYMKNYKDEVTPLTRVS